LRVPRPGLKYSRTASGVVARFGKVVPQNCASGQKSPTMPSISAAVKLVRNLSNTACASSFGPAIAVEQSVVHKATTISDLRISSPFDDELDPQKTQNAPGGAVDPRLRAQIGRARRGCRQG